VAVEVVRRLGDTAPDQSEVTPQRLASLVLLVQNKSVSQSAAKEVLDVMAVQGGEPQAIIETRGLAMAAGDEMTTAVDKAIGENPKAVEQYKAGKAKAIGAIVGAVMRETGGRADGKEVQRLVKERLEA
jgi:aspartyl-tRNA(Asn)/glutamyl-tRNA(Gln) amidotransferase subunit B